MDDELNPAQQDLLDRLRAPTGDRPEARPELRDDLRHYLHEGFAPLVEHVEDRFFVSKHLLSQVAGCERFFLEDEAVPFEWNPAIAKGSIAHRAIELSIGADPLPTPLELVDRAMRSAIRDERGVGEWLAVADDGERDQVRTMANTAVAMFFETWPPLRRSWQPTAEVPMRLDLHGGRIRLSGKVDLTVGRHHGLGMGKVVIDLKTGAPQPAHRDDLRFYALLETARTGTPPRLLATSYLDAGTVDTEAVTEDILVAAADRAIDLGIAAHEVRSGRRAPLLRPGMPCRWCPVRHDCAEGAAFIESLAG